jgi:hypothetical protein
MPIKVPRAWAFFMIYATPVIFVFTKSEPDFFIQLKGLNAGKPLWVPITNSIGVSVNKTIMDVKFMYYTFEYLFQADRFKPFLKGSVIPYIRQTDIEFVVYHHFISTMARQEPIQVPKAWAVAV